MYRLGLLLFFMIVCMLAADVVSAQQVPLKAPGGAVDWSRKQVLGAGLGVITPEEQGTRLGRAKGERAAILDARRQIMETLKDVYVDSNTLVRDFITASDVVQSRVYGVLRKTSVDSVKEIEPGVFEARLSMPLSGEVEGALLEERAKSLPPGKLQPSPYPNTPDPQTALQPDASLIIDARGHGFTPALALEIKGPGGLAYPLNPQRLAVVEYVHDVPESGSSELVRAVRSDGPGALMLEDAQARRIAALQSSGRRLENMIIIY